MTPTALVLVHGRDQAGQNPNELKATWISTLRRGLGANSKILDNIDIRFPFYGDRLEELTKRLSEAAPADLRTKGDASNADSDFIIYQQLVLERAARNAGLTDADIQRELRPDAQEKGPGSWEWVQAILRALDKLPGVSAATLELVTRDVYLYLTRQDVRKAVDEIVAPAIKGRCVVVGHSLGSIVTYRILKEAVAGRDIPLYCTIGSPLGVTGVRENLMPLAFPKGVSTWFNAYDERDLVALFPLDATRFRVKPPIVNDNTLKNETDNHHGIVEYLDKRPIASRIEKSLTGKP